MLRASRFRGLLWLLGILVVPLQQPLLHGSGVADDPDWATYNGHASGDHYSPLRQIDTRNVARLKVAWTVELGERGGLQTNPLIVQGVLYGYTPSQTVIALDAATGGRLWTFTSGTPGLQPARGMTFWREGRERTLFVASGSRMYALDAANGVPRKTFGEGGWIDLRDGLSDDGTTRGFVAMTSPPALYRDLLIVGFRAPETKPAPRGDVRAFDVRTGKLRWTFHTIPRPGEAGYATWPPDAWKSAGAANNWAGMAVDAERGIVYVPTGSAVDDFYGGDRVGDDLFADTLLALDANTGKRLWHFQGVHHDIWDRDFPSPPVLLRVHSNGQLVDAVAQTTKQGFLYLLDRVTGKPLFPVRETAFPVSDVPGEVSAKTQPVPAAPEPFARQRLTEDLLTDRTPEAHTWAVKTFRTFRSEGQFVPLSTSRPTVVFPGFDGGGEWGGPAVDPTRGVLYVNANEMAWTGGLAEARKSGSAGEAVYQTQCATCHGLDRAGAPPAFPSLRGARERLGDAQVTAIIHGGKGRMPSFGSIEGDTLKELLRFLDTPAIVAATPSTAAMTAASSATNAEGAALYAQKCALCHGERLEGSASNIPALLGLRSRMNDETILATVRNGKGRMPAFAKFAPQQEQVLLEFLGTRPAGSSTATGKQVSDKQEMSSGAEDAVRRYVFTGYRKFLDPDGYPAIQPPWGTLNAIDMNTGAYLWKVPLGEYPELRAKGVAATGSENYGGPVVTAGGVLFIAATVYDRRIRAFESATGHLLWEAELPYSGTATPATYMAGGRQYIVIATSGSRNPKGPQGSAYVAFALP